MINNFNEKCPKCEFIDWDLTISDNVCYCQNCHGLFSRISVREHWKQGKTQLTLHEQFAEIGTMVKPKPIHEIGQFKYRCPICREKHSNIKSVNECINECWKIVKEIKKDINN